MLFSPGDGAPEAPRCLYPVLGAVSAPELSCLKAWGFVLCLCGVELGVLFVLFYSVV